MIEARAAERSGRLRSLVGDLQSGDVLCAVFDSPEEQLAATAAFLRDGVARGDRCLLLAEDRFADRLRSVLPSGPPAAGQPATLVAVTNRDRVLREWAFDGDTVVRLIAQAAVEARAVGFRGLSVCIDMTWALRPAGNVDEIGRFVDLLGREMATLPAAALLLYDRIRFPQRSIEAALRAHRLIVRRECVLANPYFVPAAEGGHPRRAVDRMLAGLDRAALPTPAVESLPVILDALPQGVLVTDDAGVVRVVNQPAAALLNVSPEKMVNAPLTAVLADGQPPAGWPRDDGPDQRNLRVRCGDGRVRWVRASARRLSAAGDELLVLLDTLDPAWSSGFGSDGDTADLSRRERWRSSAGDDVRSGSRILVVGGVPELAEALAMTLIANGHAVFVAVAEEEALRLLADHVIDGALVVLDDFEEAIGCETVGRLRAADPELPVLIASRRALDRAAVALFGIGEALVTSFSRADYREAWRKPVPTAGASR